MWIRSSLVLVQVSLSFLLLVGAGLLLKSMSQIQNADPGFSTQGVLTTSVDLAGARYTTPRTRIFLDELLERLRKTPGIQSIAFARNTPFSYRSYAAAPIAVDVYDTVAGEQPTVEYNSVSPGYLATMGIALVSGREFTRADDETAPLVAVVNQTMAAQFWPGRDPIGGRVQVSGRWLQVVGVAKNSTYRTLIDPPKPFFYIPMRQGAPGSVMHIRTPLRPEVISQELARQVHAIDPNLAPSEVATMRELIDRMSWAQRAAVLLVAVFGGVALVLAGIGLYGVMSYAVSQSTRELGLRMALGAGASDLLRLVMAHGATLTAGGIVLGAAAGLAVTRLMGNLLFKVSPRDPVAFGSALAVMAIAAAAACFFPAWRATRTDPVRALRE
jgi:predicted permease